MRNTKAAAQNQRQFRLDFIFPTILLLSNVKLVASSRLFFFSEPLFQNQYFCTLSFILNSFRQLVLLLWKVKVFQAGSFCFPGFLPPVVRSANHRGMCASASEQCSRNGSKGTNAPSSILFPLSPA